LAISTAQHLIITLLDEAISSNSIAVAIDDVIEILDG
jgi:hypothetical protein